MIYSFATTSMHSLQQFGSTAAVGGIFLAVYLMTLVAIIITVVLLAWGVWRYTKAKQGKPRKPLSCSVRILVICLSLYPIWFGLTAIGTWYSGYQTDRARATETVRRNTPLNKSTHFGELEIKAGSLINRGDPHRFTDLPDQDPLLDLEAVRFLEPTPIAGVLAYAMSVEGTSLTIELAEEYQIEAAELALHCPVGYILMFPFPTSWITDEQRIQPPYDWFTPSKWKATACFDSTNGVMVMDVNEHGIYLPKNGKPYIPQPQF